MGDYWFSSGSYFYSRRTLMYSIEYMHLREYLVSHALSCGPLEMAPVMISIHYKTDLDCTIYSQ